MPIVEFSFILIGILLFLVLRIARALSPRPMGNGAESHSHEIMSIIISLVMPIIISLAILGCALYVVLSKNYAGESEKWAFGAIGTVVGYWLRPAK